METTSVLPRALVMRRLHSLFGLTLTLFLAEHLLTNSQAALWVGDRGRGFVDAVNWIHNLPYLQAIEIFLIGVPLVFHAVLGIKYALSAKQNTYGVDKSQPKLKYGRNRAYTWQRISSWILLVLLTVHVVKFRFIEYPVSVKMQEDVAYLVKLDFDSGLYKLSEPLHFKLYDTKEVNRKKMDYEAKKSSMPFAMHAVEMSQYNSNTESQIVKRQALKFQKDLIDALDTFKLGEEEVIAEAKDFGTATLLSVRNAFKLPVYMGIYTLFVLIATFHAFNGLWTFCISWGLVIRVASQKIARRVTMSLMTLIAFLGLAAIWGTYWVNLRG